MHHRPDDELPLRGSAGTGHAQLAARRRRCLKVARALLAPGALGVLVLCVWGLRPVALAIPAFLITTCALLGSVVAALFARVARLQMEDDDDDSDDDGRGPGRGPGPAPDPPADGDLEFDWERFECEFRAYAQRTQPIRA